MNIEYLENRRNLPPDGVMFLALKQDRHQNGMPTLCMCRYLWKHLISTVCTLSKKYCTGTHWKLQTAVLSAVFPDGAPQSKGKIRKRQRNPLKGWKLQLFQQFGRSRPKQRKTFKIAEKISYVPSACM